MINEMASNSNSFQLLNQNLLQCNESFLSKMNTEEKNLKKKDFFRLETNSSDITGEILEDISYERERINKIKIDGVRNFNI